MEHIRAAEVVGSAVEVDTNKNTYRFEFANPTAAAEALLFWGELSGSVDECLDLMREYEDAH